MPVVTIPTEQSAFDLLKEVLNETIDIGNLEIDYSSAVWAGFQLKLTGRRYHSTLNADLMRALVEYQVTLYRVAAFVRNGKLRGSALDENARENLKLDFEVKEGSSDIWAGVCKALPELLGKVTDGMGPKAKFVLSLTTILLLFGAAPIKEWMDTQHAIQKEQLQSADHRAELAVLDHAVSAVTETNKEQVEANQKILKDAISAFKEVEVIQRESQNATAQIMKQAKDADTVTFQGKDLPGDTVKVLQTGFRKSGDKISLTGIFKVEKASSVAGEGFSCQIRGQDGTTIQATLADAVMAEHDQKIIREAFWSKQSIQLTVSARKVGKEYRNAEIVQADTLPDR